jgi:DNA-binding phage protein
MTRLNDMLKIEQKDMDIVNRLFTDPDNQQVNALSALIERFGGAAAINEKAKQARDPENLMQRLKAMNSPYVADLEWLTKQRDEKAFVAMEDYCKTVLGESGAGTPVDFSNAVTLEISAMQFFPWLMAEAKQAIDNKELMPGRVIRVRNMAEQAQDNGDILATALAMQIMGATYVESLDTRGTDGSNIHLAGGPATLSGFFGGIGQPNHYPLKWAEEYLTYFTTYGIQQVLNVNPGTILLGYIMHRMGVDIEFKISVFVGNDNPWFILWTLMTARLFARQDGSTPLAGFNLSNSVNNDTIREAHAIRKKLGLEKQVRFEHHITETYKSIVLQPYNRRAELVAVAGEVPNISAKHEGGEPEIEATKDHPSDIFDYFISKKDILANNLMAPLLDNYLEKHRSVNLTAEALIRAGIGVAAAKNLH